MNSFNQKKVFVVISLLWSLGLLGFFFQEIERDFSYWKKSIEREFKSDKRANFESCLLEHGSSYSKLFSQNHKRCKEKVQEQCKGSFTCNDDLIFELCINFSNIECRHFYAYTPGKSDDVDRSFTRKINHFFESHHSDSLLLFLVLMFIGPILFLFAPRILKIFAALCI